MADSTNTQKSTSLFGYLFWKWLVCLLLTVPAFAVTLLAASLLGQAGGAPDGEVGFLRYGLFLAALLGYAVFLLLCMRIWLRLKLGDMPLSSFVLRETCAYAGVLLPCVLLCAVTSGKLLRTGGVSLIFLPHLPLAFFGKGGNAPFCRFFSCCPTPGLPPLLISGTERRSNGKSKEVRRRLTDTSRKKRTAILFQMTNLLPRCPAATAPTRKTKKRRTTRFEAPYRRKERCRTATG